MASKSSDIKVVISLLCKYLKCVFQCNIKPEHFRLAKFNESKENTVRWFWDILYKMCKEDAHPLVPDEGCRVNFVKLSFLLRKYDCLAFYTLPSDMSCGSRELLLAFSWLLATTQLLERVTRKRVMNASISREYGSGSLNNVEKEETKAVNMNPQFVTDYILCMAEKIKKNMKVIHELDQERIKILHQVHKSTLNTCGLNHLSVGDVQIIHNPKANSAALERLKDDALLIDTHAHWLKKNVVYWEWMETVVELKQNALRAAVSVEERETLMLFMVAVKRYIKDIMHKMKTTKDLTVNQLFAGVPRYSLQNKEPCEVEIWLKETEKQVEELEKLCQLHSKEAETLLQNMVKEMKKAYVFHKE